MSLDERTALYPLLGQLLSYPNRHYSTRAARTAHLLGRMEPELQERFAQFHRSVGSLRPAQLQELYTRTFDLSPVCILYLSVHLFGEENLQRSRLMVGLKERYDEWQFDPGTELPDHLSLVLQSAPHFEQEEWQDLAAHCLNPALEKMTDSFRGSENPFRYLLEMLRDLLRAESLLEISRV